MKKAINKLKHPLWFLSLLPVVPTKNVTRVSQTKFPATVMVFGVSSSEDDVMSHHFFRESLKLNTDVYIRVLSQVVKTWIDQVAAGYVWQQESTHCHTNLYTQAWLS